MITANGGIHRRLPIDANADFVSRIMRRTVPNDSGCIEWQGATGKKGHGRINYGGRLYSPHCVIWVAHHGQIPSGQLVCHKCDNPRCVNIEHLFLGSFSDNVRDMIAKGRNSQKRGAQHKLATHTDADAIRVRELWLQGWSQREIVAISGCARAFIMKVLSGEIWSHCETLKAEVDAKRATNPWSISRRRSSAARAHHGAFAVTNFPGVSDANA